MILLVPDGETLIRFFAERPPSLRLSEAASLLGLRRSALLHLARAEGALLPDNRMSWSEVAFRLLQAWPRAWLLQRLGAHSRFIPPGLHLTEVRWRLPLYVVCALTRQADMETTPVEDYVADALHLAIEEETVATFQNDRAFREAYFYPDNGAEEGSAS